MGMQVDTALPLFEDGSAPRILVTGWDRVEDIDAGLYRFVGTVRGTVGGVTGNLVVCYLDVTYAGVSAGTFMSLQHIKRLASGILVPTRTHDDMRH